MIKKPSNIQVNLLAAGGLDSVKSGLITCTKICKNCAMVACRRDTFSAKVLGSGTGGLRHQRLLPQPPGR